MNKYFSTFTSGFELVIEGLLKMSADNIKIELLLNGLVIYSSSSSIERIKKLNFFTNSFLLFQIFSRNDSYSVEKMMSKVITNRLFFGKVFSNSKTFRVVTSKENKSVSINQKLMIDMEKYINRNTGLKPDRSKPQVQFWFLTRSEGYGFFGMRITQHPDFGKILEKGELRPEITEIMNLLSEPSKSDIFLDPFAGSGAITKARMNFPFTKIYSSDIKPKNRQIHRVDATKLENFKNESIDKIVTDPPWGFYGEKINLIDLYTNALSSFCRVLKKDGLLIILVGDREFFEKLLNKFKDKFILGQKLYVLVNGKKAGIYKLIKK